MSEQTVSAPAVAEPAKKVNLMNLTRAQMREFFAELGEKPFRADQLVKWIYHFGEDNFDNMTNLNKKLREKLKSVAEIKAPEVAVEQRSADGTIKWAMQVGDQQVETVYIPETDRATLCVSSQVGCALACTFCSTAQQGFNRNLTVSEIIGQVWRASKIIGNFGVTGVRPITNVVMMGMGEPLVNYRNVVAALHRLIDPVPEGFGLSARAITVSTVGLVPLIRRLATEGLPVTLAVSLHAPDDGLRDELIPVNSRWRVGELLDAAHDYFRSTGRRVSIEYALIKDMNDHAWRAQRLADELNVRGSGWAHVNPIPLNPTPGSIWTCSLPNVQDLFVDTLRRAGIATTVRDTRGSDIDGACGQLATEVLHQERVRA